MKKSTAFILVLVFALVLAGGMYGLLRSSRGDASYGYSLQKNLEISGGVASPEYTSHDFGIDKDGEYNIALSWLPMGKEIEDLADLQPSDFSFITGCVISSEDDPCIYATTAGWITVDTDIELKAGNYTVTFWYLTSREAYEEFAGKYFGTASAEKMADWFEWDSFKKDDELVISYRGSVRESGAFSGMGLWILVIALGAAGLGLVLVFWFLSKGRFDRSKYDERQLIEKGKAATYAFYTMMVCTVIMFLLDAAGILSKDMTTPFYMGALVLGITVNAVYCIWHECYFALNHNRPRYMIIMAVICLMNLGAAVFDISLAAKAPGVGAAYQARLIRIGVCGFELAAAFMVLALTIFLKHRAEHKEEEE